MLNKNVIDIMNIVYFFYLKQIALISLVHDRARLHLHIHMYIYIKHIN